MSTGPARRFERAFEGVVDRANVGVDGPAVPPGPWTVERAYAYCEELARAHRDALPLVTRLVRAEMRPHLLALYAFVRTADDFADEPEYEGHRVEALDGWEEALRRASRGEATHPIFVALADTIQRRHLPIPPLEDMLSGFYADVAVRRYGTFHELRGYTARSAEPLGRLLLALFGQWQPHLVRFADELSAALQLTSFWQDVAADAARDHIYIPGEDLHFFGVTETDVKARRLTAGFRDLLRFEVARTRAHYDRGRPLLDRVGNQLRAALSVISQPRTAVLDKIEEADYDVFTRRPTLRVPNEEAVSAGTATSWVGRRLGLGLATLASLVP